MRNDSRWTCLPVDAFKLEIEGQELSGTWKWMGANKTEVQNPDGLLVTVELESSVRPIRVKVQTLLSGGPVMVRWLEVDNTGQRPTAISNVSPWAGQLWHTPNFGRNFRRLPKMSMTSAMPNTVNGDMKAPGVLTRS